MRISGDPASEYYYRPSTDIIIFYNGTPIRGCVTVDEERSWALCEVHDAKGEIVVDLAAGTIVTREITGSLKVFIPQLKPADGFDAWLAERTNAAHAAYMAHHSAGGRAYQ